MNSKIITSFLILLLVLAIPQVNAQTESIREVEQKSVELTIDSEGNVSVMHQIKNSNESRMLKFVDGTISNLEFVDKFGRYEEIDFEKGIKEMPILPDQGEFFVKYDLSDVLNLKDGVWSLDFRYLETTTFQLPEEVELVFVNQRPVLFDEKKAFACHGCELILEYSLVEPKKLEYVNWETSKFIVEIISLAEIENFEFNQSVKEISFNVNNVNQYVTTVIPLELLWGPYAVFLNNEKIPYHEYINNGTHVWVNMKPETTGEVVIIGTTVVPEFPIIAPLAIGFLMIMIMPFIRKFNLH
jgi:hypothetical protein